MPELRFQEEMQKIQATVHDLLQVLFIFLIQPCVSSKCICSVKFFIHTAQKQPYKLLFFMCFSNQSVSCNLCFSFLEWRFHYMTLKVCAASSEV